MNDQFERAYLTDVLEQFRKHKTLADRAMAQVTDEEFFIQIDPESNSIALVVKHLGGNLRSRWADFLTTDGEKPDRNRDREFKIDAGDTRASLLARWEEGWGAAFGALESLRPDDLARTVFIRGEPHSVVQAIDRSVTHAAYHVGQIVLLAKHFRSREWKTLSIPRGKSSEFNAEMARRQRTRD